MARPGGRRRNPNRRRLRFGRAWTRFGIEPVAAGLGTVKVKDEIVARFEVRAAALARSSKP